MKEGDCVLISFSGKDLITGKVFDTTSIEEAKKEGIFRENAVFKPLPVFVGKKELIPGLEKALLAMKEKEQKTVKISPSEAFGERKQELVVVVPLQEFKNRNLVPKPGLKVNLNDNIGKVQTVSGGRVRVDFNHELAGREVEYSVKIEKTLSTPTEKLNALFEKFFPFVSEPKVSLTKEEAEIIIPSKFSHEASHITEVFSKEIFENVKEIKKIRF
ncbi:MAG: peptidylprolyl isomerase, partial [archaeon]|nr:peptidylprolyl isomerase [archaeon]